MVMFIIVIIAIALNMVNVFYFNYFSISYTVFKIYYSHGKTTLLRHISERLFDVPPSIDILYCEQEVVADDTSAVNSVLKADTRCTELLTECKKLEEAQENGTADDDVTEKLNEVSWSSLYLGLMYEIYM